VLPTSTPIAVMLWVVVSTSAPSLGDVRSEEPAALGPIECSTAARPSYEDFEARLAEAKRHSAVHRILEPSQSEISQLDQCPNVARPRGTDTVRQFFALKDHFVVRDIYPAELRSTWLEFPVEHIRMAETVR
jgi:hypothetical protein